MKRFFIVSVMAITFMMIFSPPCVIAEGPAGPGIPGTIDITMVAIGLLVVIFGLVARKIFPWIKAETTTAQQDMLSTFARIGVYAAQQIYGVMDGDMKLKYVKAYLQRKGFDINTEDVKIAIEAQVQELKIAWAGGVPKPPDEE